MYELLRMAFRKLQRVGKQGSFLISLPKQWAADNELKAGDPLRVEIVDNTRLLISASVDRAGTQTRIKTLEYSPNLSRAILGAYLDGFDTIRVTGIKGSEYLQARRMVRDLSTKLFGMEIMGDARDSFELEVSSTHTDPWKLTLRCCDIAVSMVANGIEAWRTKDTELASDVVERDEEANRLYFHVVRSLRCILESHGGTVSDKGREFPLVQVLDLRVASMLAEAIADLGAEIATRLLQSEHQLKLRGEALAVANDVVTTLKASIAAFSGQRSENAISAGQAARRLLKDVHKLLTSTTGDEFEIVGRLEQVLQKAVDIADLVSI